MTLQVARASDAGFETPVVSTNLPAVATVGAFEAELFGLATNTAWIVRARATNDLTATGDSAAVPFSTALPGPAEGSVEATVAGFDTATLTATILDWGGGSSRAAAWIDVSTNADFAAGTTQTLDLGTCSGRLPSTATSTATGLASETTYFARIRLVNDWGLETVSETVSFETASDPIAFPHPIAIEEKGRISVTVAPTFVAEGTVYNVRLGVLGYSDMLGNWTDQTGFGPFTGTLNVVAGSQQTFVYTINWRYGDETGQVKIEAKATAKFADRTIESLPEIDPDYKHGEVHGAYLRPGDTVEIVPSAGARIDWHTNAVLSIAEVPRPGTNSVFVLEALEPGAALLYETDTASGQTNNVMGVAIVLPEGNPSGGVYVHRSLKDWSWTNPEEWDMAVAGPQGYPNAAGAWAIIASPALGPNDTEKKIDITMPVTVGHIAVGQLGWIHHGYPKNLKSHWPWIFSDDLGLGGSMRFDTGDGSASGLRLLGHSYTTSRVLFQIPVSMANDLEVDELNRVQDTLGWQNTRFRGLWFMKPVDIGPHTFRTVRANPYPYRFTATWSEGSHAGGVESAGWLSFRNNVLGSGTIRLEAATHVGLLGADGAHVSPFTGVWDVANGDLDPHLNSAYGGAALNTWGLSLGQSREMIVRGSWHRAEKTWPRGALVRTGFNNVRTSESTGNGCTGHAWTNDWQDALPPKITLDGGDLQIQPQGPMNSAAKAVADATGIRRNLFRIGELAVPAGPMGRMDFRNRNNSTGYAHARTEVTNLVLEPGAILSFDLDKDQTSVTHEFYLVGEPDGAWAPPGGADAQFLPFLFANNQMEATGSGGTPAESSVGEQDNTRLAFRDIATGKVTLGAPATEGNGYRRWTAGETLADGAQYYSMQLASNVTNAFADGATVQNLAGYVDMRKGAALGRPGEDGGATLDFGDEPARLFVGNWGETGTIGCRIAGTAGLVKGGNGTLAVGASLQGAEGGIRIAGGTLSLGAPDAGGRMRAARIAGDVRVEAGSRLDVRARGVFATGVRLFLEDREWIPSVGHVRLAEDAAVDRLFVCGMRMPDGWYGASGSGAERVDDVHFEGPGRLWVGIRPTTMILR